MTLNNYGGDGAYVGSLWMAGGKSKYYNHMTDWYRATGGEAREVAHLIRDGARVAVFAGSSWRVTP